MTDRDTSDALHARVLAHIEAFERGAPAPESFDRLACDIARYQAQNVDGYARLCAARGVDPSSATRAEDLPAVPAEAFKLAPVFALAPDDAGVTFRTSGTTIGARGTHLMRDARTYSKAASAFGRAMLTRESRATARYSRPGCVGRGGARFLARLHVR